MVEREDEERLERLLRKARDVVYSFALEQEEQVYKGQSEIEKEDGKLQKLQRMEKEIDKKGAVMEKKLSKKAEEIAKFAKKVEELNAREAALVEEAALMEKKYNEFFEAISEGTKELDFKEQKNEKVAAESKYGNSYYEKMLGLRIAGESGSLLFAFRNIDKGNPSREFEIALTIEQNKFEALTCKPMVENLDSLLEVLNSGDRSFKIFLVELRKSFKALCKSR